MQKINFFFTPFFGCKMDPLCKTRPPAEVFANDALAPPNDE